MNGRRWSLKLGWSFDLTAWTILCITVGLICLIYLALGLSASRPATGGGGTLLMPLDDTYIHFQYARQMAHGEFYRYNTGDDPTSGATSLLYIPLLALGYKIGFTGLRLAYWAMGIGSLALVGGGWAIYLMIRDTAARTSLSRRAGRWIAVIVMVSFAISGPLDWAAFSGMETGLFVALVLGTLYVYTVLQRRGASLQDRARQAAPLHDRMGATLPERISSGVPAAMPRTVSQAGQGRRLQQRRIFYVTGMASLAALARPEGMFVAGIVGAALLWKMIRMRRWSGWIGLPLVAICVQPALNWALTGSPAASGSQVKSHFYNETIPFGERIRTVWEFFTRMWRELLTGHSPVTGWYVPPLISGLAILAVIVALWTNRRGRKNWRSWEIAPEVIAGLWMLALTAAAATLDTGFWQFKRYQMSVMALFFPLAGWALIAITRRARWVGYGLLIGVGLISLPGVPDYAGRYYENIVVTRDQQIAMARWIAENVPSGARIAVHDVGAVAYVGHRATYDVVGLTTEGTGSAWRQGPGTFYDTMAGRTTDRPDYMAIYPDFHGLPFLAQAGVFGDELARFSVTLPHYTASAAAGIQVVTRLNWPAADADPDLPRQPNPQIDLSGLRLVGTLNVADLASEKAYDYEWWNRSPLDGFVSDVRRLPYAVCDAADCTAVDGGRILNGGERFTLPTIQPTESYLVVLRVHAAAAARLLIGCGKTLDTVVVPAIPGNWVEVAFGIPAGALNPDHPRLCITAEQGTVYDSYRTWVYAGLWTPFSGTGEAEARFVEPDGTAAAALAQVTVEQAGGALALHFTWESDGSLTRDGKLFVHLYADPSQPPAAQIDVWPGGGVLPPANWLAGSWGETITLPLAGLTPGTYQLAIGLYDPVSARRYTITDVAADGSAGVQTDGSGRLFLGEIRVGE